MKDYVLTSNFGEQKFDVGEERKGKNKNSSKKVTPYLFNQALDFSVLENRGSRTDFPSRQHEISLKFQNQILFFVRKTTEKTPKSKIV